MKNKESKSGGYPFKPTHTWLRPYKGRLGRKREVSVELVRRIGLGALVIVPCGTGGNYRGTMIPASRLVDL